MLNEQQMYLFSQIQKSQTGGQPSSDTSPYEVKLYYLDKPVKQEVSHPSLVWHSGQIGRFQNQRTRVWVWSKVVFSGQANTFRSSLTSST